MRAANLPAPVVTPHRRPVQVASIGQPRGWRDTRGKIAILKIAKLLRPDWRQARDENQLVGGRQLHHLAGRQQRTSGLLPRHHDVAEPGRQAVAGVVSLGSKLSRRAEGVGDPLRRSLVVRREGNPDVAIVEDGVVIAVSLGYLVERLCDQVSADAVASHESKCRFEEVQPPERWKFVEHHQELVAPTLSWITLEPLGEAPADLIEDETNQRLRARNVRWWDNEVERHWAVGVDEIGNSPVTGGRRRCDRRVTIEAKK